MAVSAKNAAITLTAAAAAAAVVVVLLKLRRSARKEGEEDEREEVHGRFLASDGSIEIMDGSMGRLLMNSGVPQVPPSPPSNPAADTMTRHDI